MNETLADFVRQMRISPDDWTLKLVYADALEEFGHPDLARFVRLAIKMNNEKVAGPDFWTLNNDVYFRRRYFANDLDEKATGYGYGWTRINHTKREFLNAFMAYKEERLADSQPIHYFLQGGLIRWEILPASMKKVVRPNHELHPVVRRSYYTVSNIGTDGMPDGDYVAVFETHRLNEFGKPADISSLNLLPAMRQIVKTWCNETKEENT